MRTIEKIQGKQESTKTSPFSIGLILRLAGVGFAFLLRASTIRTGAMVLGLASVVAGFCIWGWDFAWVVFGLVFCWRIIKGIASCLVSLICLIGFIYFLITHIF